MVDVKELQKNPSVEKRKPVKCSSCGKRMRRVFTRPDGCSYFECRNCGATLGEETEEWFKQMGLKK